MPSRKNKQKGGGIGYIAGLPVNNIENFSPTLVADLALWIKANPRYIKEETIQSYADKQSYFTKEALLQQFAANLSSKVITEIRSDTSLTPNSLIPLNLDSDTHTIFPTYRVKPNELDAIDISNYKEPITGKSNRLQLVTSRPIASDGLPSSYSISHGFNITQNTITNQIIITPNFIENPTPDINADILSEPTLNPNNNILAADIEPTAELSEIIVYARPLTLDESAKLEGYLAYKQNTQYALPDNHPYLPNMISDPIFNNISTQINTLKYILNQQLNYLNVAVIDYVNENTNNNEELIVNAPKMKEDIENIIIELHKITAPLSKGYLYARKINNLTLDNIYKVIKDKQFSINVVDDYSIQTLIARSVQLHGNVVELVAKIRLNTTDKYKRMIKKQTGGSNLSESTLKISDQVLFTDQQEKSKLFYQELRAKDLQSLTDGISTYNNLQNALKDNIRRIADTILHQWSDIQTKDGKLNSLLDPITKSITSSAWLKPYRNIDTSFTPIYINGKQTSIKYNNPALDLIQTYYTYVRDTLKQGDYTYIFQEFKEIRQIVNSVLEDSLNPIFKATYISYLMKHQRYADSLYNDYIKMYDEIHTFIKNINSFIDIGKETGQTITFSEYVSYSSKYLNIDKNIYLRKVINLDSSLFGLEYVEVDADGHLPGTSVIPFYSKYINYTFVNSQYVKTNPFLDISGTQFTQTYHILEPLEQSVYKGFTSDQKTPMYTHSLESLIEISRNEMNAIHCVQTNGSVEPILLPENGLEPNSWCLIYNIGHNPICVRRPDNSSHLVGPENGILYMYIDSGPQYSHRLWTKNQLPYDTILNVPRTNLSFYMEELGTSIYVRENLSNYEPIYTSDGYLVEVLADNDGYVYDYDDVYKSNKYMVSSMDQTKRDLLIFNPSMKKMVKITSNIFRIVQDIHTGFAIMLNSIGAICVNEFGFVKAIRTPIQYIEGKYKIHGVNSDIILEPTGYSLISPYDFETFINFQNVYSTHFATPLKGKNIYITNSGNPIVNPSGILIEAPTASHTGDDKLTILTPTISIDDTGVKIGSALYNLPVNSVNTIKINQERLRYNSIKMYVQSEIDALNDISGAIAIFNADALKLCVDTKLLFESSYKQIITNDYVYDKSNQPTQFAIDTAKSSIKAIMDAFFVERKKAYQDIELYKSGIDEINKLKEKTSYWNTKGSAQIDSNISKIQATINGALKNIGTTSSTELTQLLQSAIETQADFHVTLKMCMNYVLSPPVYISEVHSWYTNIQPNMEKLQSLYDGINDTLNIELPKLIGKYNLEQEHLNASQNIKSVFGSIQTKWSGIQSQKTLLDTYIHTKIDKLTPEQILINQNKITEIEGNISQGDIRLTSLYKQIKTNRASEKLIGIIKGFEPTMTEIQISIESMLDKLGQV